jgi:hypothetical protein
MISFPKSGERPADGWPDLGRQYDIWIVEAPLVVK